jgi:hypothetical protein
MDLMDGLRKMFGQSTGQQIPMRARQLEAQEQAILAPQTLRQAPVQAAPLVESGAGQVFDAAEAERVERERLLNEALLKMRMGQ